MPDRLRYLLIAAQSGRALAQAAQRAGYAPLVADLFGDLDTLELAERHVTLAREGDGAIARAGFGAAIARLTEGLAPNDIAGVVCGSGFEDRTGLIDQAALYAPLLGASGEVTRGLKDPQRFAKLCGALDIAHPSITFAPPHDPAG